MVTSSGDSAGACSAAMLHTESRQHESMAELANTLAGMGELVRKAECRSGALVEEIRYPGRPRHTVMKRNSSAPLVDFGRTEADAFHIPGGGKRRAVEIPHDVDVRIVPLQRPFVFGNPAFGGLAQNLCDFR